MPKLNLSTKLFAGAIVYFAEYTAATSDAATKPASNSALWKEIGSVQKLDHMPQNFEEKYSEVGANGWREYKDVYALADIFDLETREVSELYHRLDMGVSAAIVAGTAQSPFAASDRKVLGWIKLQHRQHSGTDRLLLDVYCEVRIKKTAPIEKKTAQPVLELYVIVSALNSMVIPA